MNINPLWNPKRQAHERVSLYVQRRAKSDLSPPGPDAPAAQHCHRPIVSSSHFTPRWMANRLPSSDWEEHWVLLVWLTAPPEIERRPQERSGVSGVFKSWIVLRTQTGSEMNKQTSQLLELMYQQSNEWDRLLSPVKLPSTSLLCPPTNQRPRKSQQIYQWDTSVCPLTNEPSL